MGILGSIIKLLGIVTLLRLLLNILKHVQSLIAPTSGIDRYLHGPDCWAFVSGSSEGIGFDLARELCTRSFNVVLHGRNRDKLEHAESSLKREFPGRSLQTIQLDASLPLADAANRLLGRIKDYKFTVLVNNVGVGHNPEKDFSPFTTQTLDEIDQILNVNVRFTTHLTHFLLPVLIANTSATSPALVLNVGSLAQIGLPWISVYSGTKSFLTTFSRALDTELKGDKVNVHVMASVVGDTDTPGHRVRTSTFTPTSAIMANAIIDQVKRANVVSVPYLPHKLQNWLCDIQPFWMLQKGLIASLRPQVKKSN